jgi:PAS domain S-box-containing protein
MPARSPILPKRFARIAALSCLCALVLILAATPGFSAAPAAHFTHLSVEQGLSQSTVQVILQDRAGFIWFGTEEGLNRYDGYTVIVFKHDPRNPESLPDDMVSALHEDHEGRLWVGTEHGLCLFDRHTETFTRITAILDRVTGILEDADGSLWIGAEGGGVFRRDPQSGAFTHYQPQPNKPGSLVSFRVSSMLRDRQSRLWAGTRDGGLEMLAANGQFIHHRKDAGDPKSLSYDDVWSIAEDHDGNLWVATFGGGLNVLDHKTGAFRQYRHREGDPNSLPTDLITALLVDKSGTLWIGTASAGVLEYDPAGDRFVALAHDPADPASLSTDVVRSLYEDVQGQLWVGTYLGGANLLKKPRSAFNYFTHSSTESSSLSDPSVAAFLEDQEGHVWVGTEQGWLNRFDPKTGRFPRYHFPSKMVGGPAIMSLHQDRHGRVWVGTYREGLSRFDPQRGSFGTPYKHKANDPKSLSDDEVWAIAEDKDGMLWLGTNAGVDRFDPDRGVVTRHLDTLTSEGSSIAGVRSLLFDHAGNLWVGSLGGLDLLGPNDDRFIRYRHDAHDPRTLSDDVVMALYEDRHGRLWVGTLGSGLNLLDPVTGTFTSYKDFASNVMYGIQEDSAGRLWMSTNRGLARFDPATGGIDNFDLANGLESLQFHPGASLKTRSGRVLFGSIDGFYDFDPDAVKLDTYAPPVVVTSLEIFNEPVKLPAELPTRDTITLRHQDKIFTLEFAALDYTFPRRNRYAYRMEGFSDNWIQLGTRREVTFTNLDPGSYVFHIKASNSDGVWHDASTHSITVIIEPPVWGTWWFRGLSVATFVLLILAGHRIRIRRLTADIAQRRRAEEALRDSQQLLQAIIDNSTAVIFVKDLEGRYLLINRRFEELFHVKRDSIAGKTDYDLFSRERADAFRDFDRRVLAAATALEAEELIPQDGHLHTYISIKAPLCDKAGKAYAVCSISTDLTERKQLEEHLRQAQKMEAVGQLAGGIAHDFNNLLNVILGSAELLMEETPSPELRSHGENIRRASDQAKSLTRQLLAFSRQQVIAPKVLNVNTVLQETGVLLPRLIGEDVEIIVQAAPEPALVHADPIQLQQIVLNLAVNARDAMPKGGSLIMETGFVELDQEAAMQLSPCNPGSYVLLSVSDTGTGIPVEVQPHVFEPFFTTKEQGKGTGLGLFTVYGIVQQVGGAIAVHSDPGAGTTFKIYLPRVLEAIEVADVPLVHTEVPQGTETILLVEDQDCLRNMIADFLQRQGYTVLESGRPNEAIEIATRHKEEIRLLLTDVVMPEMHGPELAQHIRELCPQVKMLFLSGYTPDRISFEGMSESEFSFLEKPVAMQVLVQKVREMLSSPRVRV